MTNQTEFDQLMGYVGAWHGRRQTAALLLWLPRGVLGGLLVGVVVAAVARWRPLLTNAEVGYMALGLAAVGLLAGAIWSLRRRPAAEQTHWADVHFGLHSRLTAAVELQNGRITTSPELADLQLRDALAYAQQVDAPSHIPLRLDSRDWGMILLAVALLVAAVVLPNPQADILLGQRAIQTEIAAQIEAIEELEEAIAADPDLTEAQKEELLQPLEDAREELAAGDLSREQGMATLSQAEAELRDLEASNDNSALQEQLAQAGAPLADNQSAQQMGESLQQGQLGQASQATAELAESLPSLTAAEQAELAEALAETAAGLQGTDDALAQQLAQAAEALQNGDTAAAQQALEQASATLQERAQEQAASQAAGQAAETLSEGQQEIAQAGQEGQQEGQEAQAGQQGQEGEGQQGQQGQGEQGQAGQGGQEGQSGQEQGQGQSGQAQGQGSSTSEQGAGAGGVGQGGGPGENIFVPEYVDLSGYEGVEVELPAECVANPALCGELLNQSPTAFGDEQSVVPYSQVYGQYRDTAYEALNDDYIPLGLKGYIRDYFSSLEPNR